MEADEDVKLQSDKGLQVLIPFASNGKSVFFGPSFRKMEVQTPVRQLPTTGGDTALSRA